jgi:ketosteroid isomerase-like protein
VAANAGMEPSRVAAGYWALPCLTGTSTLLRAFESWNTSEAPDMSLLDPDVSYEDTALPDHVGETHRGHEGVARAVARWFEPFAEITISLQRIVGEGDCLVSIHRVRRKARHTGIEFGSPLAYAYVLRDGSVVHVRSLWEPQQALDAAGLAE